MPVRTAVIGALLAVAVQAVPPPAAPSVPPAQAQAQAQQPQRPTTFRSGAELVRVDVTVLNNKGQPVRDLRAEDFELEEDGITQKIQSFALLDLAPQTAADGRNLEVTSHWQAEQELAREDVRVFLLFWDEYHIPPQFQSQILRNALVNFLRTMVAPTDLVAIMDPWTPISDLRWSRDRALLWNTALGLRGRQGVFTPPRNVAEENHLREYGSIPRLRAQVSLSALQSAMLHLGAKREGRKAIIYFSREFRVGDRMDDFTETLDLMRTANDANIAFYAVNPDGITMRGMRTGILTDLARESGGEALVTNDAAVALRRVVEQTSAVYLVGYAPAPLRRDGKFHKIKVNVKRSGIQVRARSGYWSPDEKTIAAAKTASVAAVVPTGIEAAIGELARLDRHDGEDPLALPTVIEPAEPSAVLSAHLPRLWLVQRPADLRAVLGQAPPDPTAQREFARTDRLILRFELAGTGAGAAQVAASLIDRRGKRLVELPLKPEAAGWILDLPFASIARGDYVIALEARSGETRTAAYVPVRVKP
jgi:VWFA-related protein